MSWWLPSLRPELSQGDVFSDVPFVEGKVPLEFLEPKSFGSGNSKNGFARTAIPKKDDNGRAATYARVLWSRALLLSHDCEIDKVKSRKRLLLCRVESISTLPEDQQVHLLGQRKLNAIPLPDIPGSDTAYADLRTITAIYVDLIEPQRRIASMTDEARLRLEAQIFAFFTRRRLPT